MRQWLINEDEDEALQGLPLLAQVLYIRGLRPFMDYDTGIVGQRRGISRQMLKELLEVDPTPTSLRQQPSTKAIRHALERLKRVGLTEQISEPWRMVFRLPFATVQDQSVSGKRGRRGAGEDGPEEALAALRLDPERGAKEGPEKRGRPPVSGKYSDANASAAPGSDPAPGEPDEDPVKVLFDTGVAILTKAGKTEQQARQIVGRLRQSQGDGGALEVLISSRFTTDPTAWIMASVTKRSNNGATHQRGREDLQTRRRREIDEYLARNREASGS